MSNAEQRNPTTAQFDNPLSLEQFLPLPSGRSINTVNKIKLFRNVLLRDVPLCTAIVENTVAILSSINQTRPVTEEGFTAAGLNVFDIYEGLQILGTPRAQLAALEGALNDPSQSIRESVIDRFAKSNGKSASGENTYPYIHPEVFDKLLEPTHDKETDKKRGAIALRIIDSNPSAGFDTRTGKVFPSVDRLFSTLLRSKLPEDELLKHVYSATKLNERAASAPDVLHRHGHLGLSERVRSRISEKLQQELTNATKLLKPATRDDLEELLRAVAKKNLKLIRQKEGVAAKDKIPFDLQLEIKKLENNMIFPEEMDAKVVLEALKQLYAGRAVPAEIAEAIQEYDDLIAIIGYAANKILPILRAEEDAAEKAKSDAAKKKADDAAAEAKRLAEQAAQAEQAHQNALRAERLGRIGRILDSGTIGILNEPEKIRQRTPGTLSEPGSSTQDTKNDGKPKPVDMSPDAVYARLHDAAKRITS